MHNNDSGDGFTLKKLLKDIYVRFLEFLPQAAPLIPSEEVKVAVANVGLSQNEVSLIFKVFLRLRHKDGNKWVDGKMVLSSSSVVNILRENRNFLQGLLRNILQLGGCYEFLDWSHFLFIFVRFCSLSKVELSQLLFLIIVRELKGLDSHYLTSTQLDRFYDSYRVSGVPENMDCGKIRFSNFPLSRYYVTDFVEMCFLYSPLIYQLQSLQRKFQSVLPSLRFWDEYASTAGTSRKVTLDFFLIKKANLQISGNTSFQETCDLLLLSSHFIHERLREKQVQDRRKNFQSLSRNVGSKDLGSGGKSSSLSLGKNAERWMEMDFLSRNRKLHDDAAYNVASIYRKMDANPLLIKKSSILESQ